MLRKIIIVLLFFPVLGIAQNSTISGVIKDAASAETLVGVTIVDENHKKYTTCNEYGFYSITLPNADVKLIFSFSGYREVVKDIKLYKDTVVNVDMPQLGVELQKIVISGTHQQVNSYNLPMSKVSTMPVVAGETDVIKSLVLTPGVTAGNEGSASLNVRGGSPDQNLFLLDGIPVYNVNHIFGFFSVFNTDALKSVKLIKGGISAQYSGRTSSVVDMYMKEGDLNKIHGKFTIGLISSKFLLEGPVKKNKSSFLITGRRTYLDVLFRPVSKFIADNTVTGYYFYDINAKWNYKLSDKNRLFFSFYTGQDKGYVKAENFSSSDTVQLLNKVNQDIHWGNITGAFRWQSILSSKISMNNTFFYTKFNYGSLNYSLEQTSVKQDVKRKEYSYSTGSGIQEIGYKLKFDFFLSTSNMIKTGVNLSEKDFFPNFSSEYYNDDFSDLNIDKNTVAQEVKTQEFSSYIEDNIKFGFFNTVIGVNYNGVYVNKKLQTFIEPRVSAKIIFSDNVNLQASFCNVHQYIHLLTNSSVGMPTDLWVPSTDVIKPINSNIYDVGFDVQLDNVSVYVSGFYKDFDNLIMYKQGTFFLDVKTDWQDKVTAGSGYAYGVEFSLQKLTGKFTGQISYTYSRSLRIFDEINNGNIFPYKYDRPHNFNLQAEYHINNNVLFSANWVLMSGQNATYSYEYYVVNNLDNNNQFYRYISGYNNLRFPLYHRLDVAFNFTKKRIHTTRIWSVGIYNIYNRLNPYYLESGIFPNTLLGTSFAPIMPFVSYSIKF